MCDVFDDIDFVGVMNVPYIATSTKPHIKPFMNLAETLGTILGQLAGSSEIDSIELQTWGGRDVNITTNPARQLMEAQVLKGFIKSIHKNYLPDLISAPIIAKEIGLKSVISNEIPVNAPFSPYWNLISLIATRKDGTITRITGSVFGTIPHITQIDDYQDLFAFKPEGSHVLTFRNEDRPGAVGEVLTILSEAKVNVANINVARASMTSANKKDKIELTNRPALTFLSLDGDVPAHALTLIKSHPSLQHVAVIKL